MLDAITSMAAEGRNMTQIADALGVSRKTLYNWREEVPEVGEAIDTGQMIAIEDVENILLNMCRPHEEEDVTEEYDGDWNIINRTIHRRTVMPKLTTVRYFLENRCRKRWGGKDKPGGVAPFETTS